MGTKGERAGGGRRARRGAARRRSAFAKAPRTVYLLKPEHLELVHELDRLFPDLAPVVDFGAMAPGAESVELVSQQIAALLERRFEQPLFMAFCHVNSERLLAVIQQQIDDGALPFDAQVVLADLYYRWFDRWRGTTGGGRGAPATGDVYSRLVVDARQLVLDRAEQIRGMQLPLPGLPFPEVAPAAASIEQARSLLDRHGCRLGVDELKRWIAHALLSMPARPRLLLHLRDQRGLSAGEIGARLGITSFNVLLELRRASVDLDERIVALLGRFHGWDPSAADAGERPGEREPPVQTPQSGRRVSLRPDPAGRILRLRPPSPATEEDPPAAEPEPDPKGPSP